MESFGSRLRDELLAVEAFTSLLEARVLVEDWRIEYNTIRPHSALGYLTPTDYAKTWTPTNPNSHNRWINNRGPVNPTWGLLLLDVRHPQDMRGPRCRLGAYGAVSGTSPRFMTKSR